MGYPMTYQRFVNRNSLHKGDYTDAGEHGVQVNITHSPDLVPHRYLADDLQRYERSYQMLLGDLRRLEHDVVDEQSLCQNIAQRTGVDVDVVAAVLKEFMSL